MDSTSGDPRFEPYENFLVYYLFLFFFFFHLLFWFGSLKFVGMLVVVFFFSYGLSKQTRSLLLLDLYYSAWRAICESYHGFIMASYHVTDCRSEGVVPANTLKRLVRKRKYKNIFSQNCIQR